MSNNIGRILDDNVRKFGEYKQFIFLGPEGEQSWTNKAILDHAKALATGLQGTGVKKGDIIGSVISNIPEIPEIMNGVNRMGAVYLPIIYMLTPGEIRYILQDSACKVVITEDKLLSKVREAATGLTTIEKIIVIGKETGADIVPYNSLLKDSSKGDVADVDKDSLAILMYTSGTTGFPKGVMLTHYNLDCQFRVGMTVWGVNFGDTLLTTIPMNHIYGVLSCLEGYFSGFVNILMPPFDPRKVLDVLKQYNVKAIPVVPTMLIFMMMVADSQKDDLSFMDLLICSGGPLALDTIKQSESIFHKEITQGYGCTEVGGSIARQRRDWPRKPGSVGFPLPGLAVRIVDDEGNDVARGSEGEIICKGPTVTRGYLNKPKETAETVKDGWLHTGDLGKFDEDGELYVTGRKKDLIIKGGENIDPGVAEGWLYKHPAVMECAVIAIPDATYSEEVGAAIVLKPGQSVTEDDLLKYLREHLHEFVAPKKIFFMEALPKTGLGKILKREIRRIVKEKMQDPPG